MIPVATIAASPTQYQAMLEQYSSIVEKTNNQLGLWINVGNWFTTGLGVLVAIIAIFVGYAIWKNSNDVKLNHIETIFLPKTSHVSGGFCFFEN